MYMGSSISNKYQQTKSSMIQKGVYTTIYSMNAEISATSYW